MRLWFRKHVYPLTLVALFTALLSIAVLNPASAQQTSETWMDTTSQPVISAGNILDRESFEQIVFTNRSVFGKLECEEKAVNFSPADHPTSGMPMEGCWYTTSVGEIDKGGYMFKPTEWEVGGFVNSFNSRLFPTPNDSVFLEVGGDNSVSIRRSDMLVDNLGVRPADTGWDYPVFLEWSSPASLTLEYADGTPWQISDNILYDQMSYSKNGNHLVIWESTGSFLYIDLTTLSVKNVRVTKTTEPLYTSVTISENGRYVAVNILNQPGFEIFDLWSCETTDPSIVSDPVHCVSRSFQNSFSDLQLNSTIGAFVEFHSNDFLSFYIDEEGEYFEVVFQAPNIQTTKNYLALGDSYVSGEGAYNYLPGTDEPNNRCHLSSKSYPFLLGDWLKLDSTHSVACSGARIHNIIGGHINDAAQNHQETSDKTLGKWMPGYQWQGQFIRTEDDRANIITIGIGGNNIGFSDKIKECLKPSVCFTSTYDRIRIALEINDQFDSLVSTFSYARREALKNSPVAKVYVVGYPQILSASGSVAGYCGNNVRLTYEEIQLSENLISYLNNTIRQAAKRAGVSYISIENALDGYKLCDKTNTNAVNGLTVGDGTLKYYLGPIAIESFHPSVFGHTLIASAIREKTDNFSFSLPYPDQSATAPNPLKNLLVGNASDMPPNIRKLVYGSTISADMLYKNKDSYILVTKNYNLIIGSKVTIEFHSDPTLIGEYIINETGILETTYSIPQSLKPGLHTIHIYGQNNKGQDIDIYKTVYVAESEQDWDGDGILNDSDVCNPFNITDDDKACLVNNEVNNTGTLINKDGDLLKNSGYMASENVISESADLLGQNILGDNIKNYVGEVDEKTDEYSRWSWFIIFSFVSAVLLLIPIRGKINKQPIIL